MMTGEIKTIAEALTFFEKKMDTDNLNKIKMIKTERAVLKIANAASMCDPDSIIINTGSEADKETIRKGALSCGEETKLAMEKHTVHFDLKEEQGRITDRTFYMAEPDEDISSLANRVDRNAAYDDVKNKMTGIMRGMTMIVGFYMRGPIGAVASNPAIEITSSFYVSHSAEMLYRNCYSRFDDEVKNRRHFYTNIHSQGKNRPEDLLHARVYMDRHEQTTYSINCTYAGNTLLLKKGNHRFSIDKAVYQNRGNELSEHMFITGIQGPGGRITWFAGAAPSGCGKTTTAMAGCHFVGDDLAQMWIDDDGFIRSINPEAGIFGIVEDVNWDGDPKLMELLRKPGTEVIWSNVLVDDAGVPHWTGNGEDFPDKGRNYQGDWAKDMENDGKNVPLSHPNARVTIVASALDNYSPKSEDPKGVPTSVITYSGRDSDTMPPVWVAKTMEQGVVIGACIVSAATATEVGASGVKRSPWANAAFIPGALGDYMEAQFQFFTNPKLNKNGGRPIIAGLNYFLTDEARGGSLKKLLGEKRDVKVWLSWLDRRFHNEVGVIETPIGYIPQFGDLKILFKNLINKDYTEDLYIKQFSLYLDNIIARIDLQRKAYANEKNLPATCFKVLDEQKAGLLELKKRFGGIVKPMDLV